VGIRCFLDKDCKGYNDPLDKTGDLNGLDPCISDGFKGDTYIHNVIYSEKRDHRRYPFVFEVGDRRSGDYIRLSGHCNRNNNYWLTNNRAVRKNQNGDIMIGRLRLVSLTKRFGNLTAVDEISLKVKKGELL